MKKLLALILAMLMLMATLAGCGEDKEKDKDEDSKPSVSQEKDDPKPEKEPEKKDESKEAVKVTDAVLKAMLETGDGETLVNAMPEQIIEAMLAEGGEGHSKQEIIDVYDEELAYIIEELETEKRLCYYEIIWEDIGATELGEDEIEAIAEIYKDELGMELDIAAAIEVEYKLTVEVDVPEGEVAMVDVEEQTIEFVLTAIKVDGVWCFDLSSLANVPTDYT